MTSIANSEEPTIPYPPRFWWLKRIAAFSVLALIAYIAVMKWWGYEAHQRLQAEIDAIHSRGEPILVEDFQSKPVPDELNAALSLIAAQGAIALNKPQQTFFDNLDLDVDIDASGLKMLEQINQSTLAARQLARTARYQPKVDWGVTIRSPAIYIALPNLGAQRELAILLSASAFYEHQSGHDAEAIEIARDLLKQSDLMESHSPALVSHLVAIGVNALASTTARRMSYDLAILREPGATTSPSTEASREQVLSLINELMDDRAYRQGAIYAMFGERMFQYDSSVTSSGRAAIGAGIRPFPFANQLSPLQPMFELDATRMMQMMTTVISASAALNYPAAKAQLPDIYGMKQKATILTTFSRLITVLMMPSLDRAMETHFRGLAERRVAALDLAIRLYQLDHDGNLPGKLADLVPNYLHEMPIDPFSGDGRAFGYRTAPVPMIYSVGVNGVDDGGDTSLLPNAPRVASSLTAPPGHPKDSFNWYRRDVIFPLTKPRPLPPPATDPD